MLAAPIADTVQLILPVNSKTMRVVRLTTAGVMANAGLSIDKTEDIKLAVEESCSCMIQHSRCASLHLTFRTQDDVVSIQIVGSNSGNEQHSLLDEMELQVIECILASMVDSFEIRHEQDKPYMIELVVKIAA